MEDHIARCADTDSKNPILRETPIFCGKDRKVFVTGFFDLLNSGQVSFLKEAAEYGDLYVGVGSDATFRELKGREPVCSEMERLYMVKAVRYVKDAFIMGSGHSDRHAAGVLRQCPIEPTPPASIDSDNDRLQFEQTLDILRPDILVVNPGTGSDVKRKLCESRGIKYIVLGRYCEDDTACSADTQKIYCGKAADTTKAILRGAPILSPLPYRIDIAGTWIDQPYVSEYGPGWAITASIEPTYEFMERGGMSTSTRNAAKKIWPIELPPYNEEMLARLLFCFENDPENEGHVSGAQDAIGICVSGLSRHYYDGHYWPERIETIHDEDTLSWLESHVCVVPMFPRRPGCSVVEGKDITPEKVRALTDAAARCWDAILSKDLNGFAEAFRASFEAQIAMFPAMMQPGVQEWIDKVKPHALAWKMLGAGGGGNLLLVVDSIPDFAIPVKIRRRG